MAVDGVDAAGKTTLADELAEMLRPSGREILRASIDSFHNPREIRYRQGPDSAAGYYEDSFDLPALRRDLLDPLGPGGTREYRLSLFDFRTDQPAPAPAQIASTTAILLLDGVFLLRPELSACWDLAIFVQVKFETVLARAVERDGPWMGGPQAVIDRYTKRYIPAQRRYLETCRPDLRAQVVIINDDPRSPEMRDQ